MKYILSMNSYETGKTETIRETRDLLKLEREFAQVVAIQAGYNNNVWAMDNRVVFWNMKEDHRDCSYWISRVWGKKTTPLPVPGGIVQMINYWKNEAIRLDIHGNY